MSDKIKKNKGGRPRVDNPKTHKCNHCDYSTTQTTVLKTHYLAHHATEEERLAEYKFYCHICKVGFLHLIHMENHKNTKGHKRRAC